MSYYNYCFIPCNITIEETDEDKHLVFDKKEDGFDNMVKLMNLDKKFIQVQEFTNIKYVVFEEVPFGSDYLRPRDLNWRWHNRETFYGHPDCFIFVADIYERLLDTVDKNEDMLKAIGHYQNGIKKYGKELVIYPL